MAGVPKELGRTWGLVAPQLLTEGITSHQMAEILTGAANRAQRLIEANIVRAGSVSGEVTDRQLRMAIRGIDGVTAEMWSGVGKVTKAGMFQAGDLAAGQALDLDLLLGMPGNALLQYSSSMYAGASQAIEDIVSRRTAGFKLQDRIYAHGRVSTSEVGRIVEESLALGRSARQIAGDVRGYFHPNVPGGASFAAMRVGRTEINNAHHETTKRLAKGKPWVLGMQWNLSGSHPKPDACNDYAEHEEGLGRGGWADAPLKPHPMCLCYLTHLTIDEQDFMDGLVQGDYDNYLEEQGVSC